MRIIQSHGYSKGLYLIRTLVEVDKEGLKSCDREIFVSFVNFKDINT